jgi:hypothetical protein
MRMRKPVSSSPRITYRRAARTNATAVNYGYNQAAMKEFLVFSF